MRAYAAATGSLLDLFGDTRSLRLTSTQERALTLNVSFTGFGTALAAPISLLDRVANSMWESARFERETASLNRETAELLRTNVQDQSARLGIKLQSRRRR